MRHTYSYDLVNNRLTTSYGGTNRTITSTYDVLNRLSIMTESGRPTGYGYDLNGNIVTKLLPNCDEDSMSYDALNRDTSQTSTHGTNTLFTFNNTYDLAGNLLVEGEMYPGGLNNRIVTNTYDNIYRLTTEAVTGSATNTTTNYSYDNANNRATQAVTTNNSTVTTTYTSNNLNQLTTYTDTTGRAVNLTYDVNGNRITRTVSGGSDSGTDTYLYDADNRLVTVTKGTTGTGTGTYNYQYDYRTRRILRDETQVSGGTSTQLIFSGGTSVQEYDNNNTSPTVEYIRGSDYGGGVGGILYTLRSGTPSYTHENKRGDVVAKTDATGSLTYQAQYQAFGAQVATTGATLDRQKANSKDYDGWGATNEGFRYRELETGTFLTRDPAGMIDGPNEYTYVRQNPWSAFDAEGLDGTFVDEAGQGLYNLTHQSLGASASALGLDKVGTGLYNLTHQSLGTSASALGLDKAAAGGERLVTGQVSGSELSSATGLTTAEAGYNRLSSGQVGSTELLDATGRGLMDGILTFGGGGLGKLGKLGKEADEINALNKATAGGEPPGEVTAKTTCTDGKCFPPGTMVLMADGSSKAIETIKVGDIVKCEDPNKSHKVLTKTVLAIVKNWAKRLIHIKIRDRSDSVYNSKRGNLHISSRIGASCNRKSFNMDSK